MEGKHVSSATLIVTQQNIEAREKHILELRGALRKMSKKDPRRPGVLKRIQDLLTEIAALRASIHYYKPTPLLSDDIVTQRKKVKALTALFKKSKGPQKQAAGRQLRKAAKTLNEMLAAAKAQQAQTGIQAPLPEAKPDLTLVPPLAQPNPLAKEEEDSSTDAALSEAVEEADASAAAEGFQPSDFSLEAIPEAAEEAIATLEESWDKLDEYRDEEGEVWYKNPIILAAAGAVSFVALRRILKG